MNRDVHATGLDSPGFDESIRGLIRGSPWWLTSAAIHLALLFVLYHVRVEVNRITAGPRIVGSVAEALALPDEPVEIEKPIAKEPETIIEKMLRPDQLEPRDVQDNEPSDDPSEGVEGLSTGPFLGDGLSTAIGLGGGGGGGRGGGTGKGVRGRGGDGRTEIAVELGLKWLADHQDLAGGGTAGRGGMLDGDGRWDCDDFAKHDPADDRCDGAGSAPYDVGVTGLALLAFLGAGYTDRGTEHNNPFARNVRAGLRYLRSVQDEDGCFGTRVSQHFMYNHAIATLAMCEAYWMTRNPLYKRPAQQGLNFIARSRNPYLAWRYEPRGGDNDSSVTGWMVMALKSGKFGGLEIDPDAFEGARAWIEKMTDPDFGQVGYNMPGGTSARPEGLQDRFPPEKTQAMTAVGVLTRIFLGEDPRTSRMIRMGADLCLEHPPEWDPGSGVIDMYYWYYATLAMFQVGGNHWRRWNKSMKTAIVEHQHQEGSGSRTGSWDPIGPWGPDGGRVYSTASMVMCLEVYYRYDRVFGTRSSGRPR